MQLHPTRSTFHVGLSGAAMVAMGIAARVPAVVAFGGAIVLAVAVGRALALASVTRLRASGFEMVWAQVRRVVRTTRGSEVRIQAELRNRGVDEARGVNVRAVASSMLKVTADPPVVDIPGGGRVRVDIVVEARRVGRWGLHGVSLEARSTPGGGEGLYEVPLMFANPLGVEVLPKALQAIGASARGGRSRSLTSAGRTAMRAGEGDELRELRQHVSGDPFKRIAWKASARRGQLMVRETERDERDVVWLFLDASVELWAGEPGRAPLDSMVDEVAAAAAYHLGRGDLVGLAVVASRLRTFLQPDGGAVHGAKIAAALASSASMVDADRTELDEYDVAQRVSEHARPLDSAGLVDVARGDLDKLAARAELLRARAPFAARKPFSRTPREEKLRHYLASFGLEVPPRIEGEREKTEQCMAAAFERTLETKPRPSLVHVWGAAPASLAPGAAAVASPGGTAFRRALARLRGKRVAVHWTLAPLEASVVKERRDDVRMTLTLPGMPGKTTGVQLRHAVEDAVLVRLRAGRRRDERALRRLGIKPSALMITSRARTTTLAPSLPNARNDSAEEPAAE